MCLERAQDLLNEKQAVSVKYFTAQREVEVLTIEVGDKNDKLIDKSNALDALISDMGKIRSDLDKARLGLQVKSDELI